MENWQDPDAWPCPQCTFLNNRRLDKCQMCGFAQPPQPQKKKMFDIALCNRPTSLIDQSSDEAGVTPLGDDGWGSGNDDGSGWSDDESGESPPTKKKRPNRPEEKKEEEGRLGPTASDGCVIFDPVEIKKQTRSIKNTQAEGVEMYDSGLTNACLKPKNLRARIEEAILELAGVMDISEKSSSLLLLEGGWNQTKILERFTMIPDEKAKEEFWQKNGIKSTCPEDPQTEGKVDCFLCCETLDADKMFHLGCGHQFCVVCWKNYLNAELDKGPVAVSTRCPGYKCGMRIPPETFTTLLPTQKLRERYEMYLFHSYVSSKAGLKPCPAPNCPFVIQQGPDGLADVECLCGSTSCFDCSKTAHGPCTCELYEKWEALTNKEADNSKWILANTKKCPKCKVNIEKNQGCMHMTCRQCKHEFCWLCKGNWRGHSNCNKSAETQAQELSAADAKNWLQRFTFYITRVDAHLKALKFAKEQFKEFEGLVNNMVSGTRLEYIDVEFIIHAVKEIIHCRSVLCYTYVYSYYIRDGSKEKKLFEFHQGQLEGMADKLHELLDKHKGRDVVDHRVEIMNFTKAVQTLRFNLTEHISMAEFPMQPGLK